MCSLAALITARVELFAEAIIGVLGFSNLQFSGSCFRELWSISLRLMRHSKRELRLLWSNARAGGLSRDQPYFEGRKDPRGVESGHPSVQPSLPGVRESIAGRAGVVWKPLKTIHFNKLFSISFPFRGPTPSRVSAVDGIFKLNDRYAVTWSVRGSFNALFISICASLSNVRGL